MKNYYQKMHFQSECGFYFHMSTDSIMHFVKIKSHFLHIALYMC